MQQYKPVIKKQTGASTAEEAINKDEQEMLDYLEDQGIDKTTFAQKVGEYYNIAPIDLEGVLTDSGLINEFGTDFLKAHRCVPYAYDDNTYYFAISDPVGKKIKENIARKCQQKNAKAIFKFAFYPDIQKKISEIEGNISGQDYMEIADEILNRGMDLGASDIHVEPRKDSLWVRYRVDGYLSYKKTYHLPQDGIAGVISRLKVMSYMDIAQKRSPQDGRIPDFKHKDRVCDLRVSSVPISSGDKIVEKIVMRIFDKSSKIMKFRELGYYEHDIEIMRRMLSNPYGIVYLGGASGTGKTTTLYTMVGELDSTEINIASIEDPIEKDIQNVNQTQIETAAGVTFPTTLRHLLRQDPDVLVVGEIRDRETAGLALQASLTGHLVLTTIHANSALDAVNRLDSMELDAYTVAASTLGFVSQRLVRRLCECKRETKLTSQEKVWVQGVLDKYGEQEEPETYYAPHGCARCGNIGYKGRMAIVEIVEIDDELRDLLAKNKTTEMRQKAQQKEFTPMKLDAYRKAKEGKTTIKEIMKVF